MFVIDTMQDEQIGHDVGGDVELFRSCKRRCASRSAPIVAPPSRPSRSDLRETGPGSRSIREIEEADEYETRCNLGMISHRADWRRWQR